MPCVRRPSCGVRSVLLRSLVTSSAETRFLWHRPEKGAEHCRCSTQQECGQDVESDVTFQEPSRGARGAAYSRLRRSTFRNIRKEQTRDTPRTEPSAEAR